jgi:hypothetical protein
VVHDADPAAVVALHETVGFQSTQCPVHHHAARADHGCQVGSLRNWMGRVEDRFSVPSEDGSHPLARILEGSFIEPDVDDHGEIRRQVKEADGQPAVL